MDISSHQQPMLLSSAAFSDERGSFIKIFDRSLPLATPFDIRQINYVENPVAGVIRGMHFQKAEHAEAKIFRVLKGKVQLGYVDLRVGSPTYLCSGSYVLDCSNQAVFVPRGFATGYAVLIDGSLILYLSDNHYAPASERGIRWNDPLLQIQWQVVAPVVSAKDQGWPNYQL